MTEIELDTKYFHYVESLRLITISERNVKFDTAYRLWNPITEHGKVFNFSHSTGPEFSPDTKYIYKSDDGFTLEIVNDHVITEARKQMYINSKPL